MASEHPIIENPNDSMEVAGGEAANNVSTKIREEGEISSSYDGQEDRDVSSTSQFDGAQVEQVKIDAINDNIQTEMDTSSKLDDVPSTAPQESNHLKSSEKNRGAFVPFLISFSDDDSGSDRDNAGQKNTSVTKNTALAVDRSQRPSAVAPRRQTHQKVTRNPMPRKGPLSRTFVPTSKISGGGTSTYVGRSQNPRLANNTHKVSTLDHAQRRNLHLDSRKLQDLRHLIAMRENQLKLQPSQKAKRLTSSSSGDDNHVNMGALRETASDNLQSELKEPDNKRQKIALSNPSKGISNTQENMHSVLASTRSAMRDSDQQNLADHRNLGKKVPSCSLTAAQMKHTENQGPVSSTKKSITEKEGLDAVMHPNKSSQKFVPVEPVISSRQAASKAANRMDVLEHPTELSSYRRLDLLQKKVNPRPLGNDLAGKCDDNQVSSVGMAQKPVPDINNVTSFIQVAGGNGRANAETTDLPSFWNCYDKLNVGDSMDLQSLTEVEESQDKELEEAQEYRRQCEIEEINALKAYRKAQRALLEANARCSYLYNRREQYSAQLRYHLMYGNPNIYLSSGTHEETGIRLNPLNSNCNVDMHLIPTSSRAAQPPLFNNQQGCYSTIHPDEGALHNVYNTQIEHQNLVTDPFSEPDGSTSEPHKKDHGASGRYSPSEDFIMSQDEDEGAVQYKHKSPENSSEYHENRVLSFEKGDSPDYGGKGKSCVDEEKNEKNGSDGPLSMDNSQDSLLLEASLRSQLFERLKMRSLSQTMCQSETVEPLADERVESGEFFGKVGMSIVDTPFSDTDKENRIQKGNSRSQFTSSAAFLYPILRSAFSNLMVADSMNFLKLQSGIQNVQTCHYPDEGGASNLDLVEPASLDCKSGSYSCNFNIDPLWPLCMYELRGKCNNDECTLQHFRDYSSGSGMESNLDSEDKVGSESQGRKCALTKSLDCLTLVPPTYLVGLDVLKADVQSSKSILCHKYGQQWSKCFSLSFVLSSQLPANLPSKEPCFHGTDARIEVHGGWNRQSLYFHSKNGALWSGKEPYTDDDQSLELALLCLTQEANKRKGRIQALKVLARALETNPTSAPLWIIYLLIYYSSQKSIGEEDMFRCAVEHNEGSYELWLLHINSRTQLEDRLDAYDAALSALCHHASASDTNTLCISECILDIFLQMMDFLRMSGNIGKALEKIYGLYPTTKKSDNLQKPFLPDIIICLTISDKCIFWICCIYFVVYRKLPDAIVQQFEYTKELSSIDWPFSDLTFDEKQRGVSLMELAVDSLALYIDKDSLEDEANLRAAHLFSVNHVRCVAVLQGLECSRTLLERYVKLYPSGLELVLMFARAEHEVAGGESFEGYEEALDNWLDEVPGVQCVWNQYVQCALQHGKHAFAKELMTRWFNSQCSLQSASVSDLFGYFCNYNSQNDTVFGLLNFSIYKLLQNDHHEAQLAIDKALEAAATAGNYIHCAREKLLFMTTIESQDNGPVLKFLCGYLADNRASSFASEPLSRKFIQRLEKPRVQQLVGKLLSPLQLDPSLVNSVLEALHGQYLLPQTTDKVQELIDFVESLMEILPSNYNLAISVCKQLTRNSNAANVPVNVSFWASSLLSNALFQAIPVAPEKFWVEAAGILHDLTDSQTLCTTLLKRALSIYPFSMMLWKIYLNLSEGEGNAESVKEAAGLKGIKLE